MTDQELLQAIGQVVEAKLEPIRQDICELKGSVQRLETRMDHLETKMDSLETRMDHLETKMDSLETRMNSLETRMDHLETRMDSLETRMDSLETRVGKLEEQVQGIRVYMETDQRRTLNLLLEGQQALWDRFVPHEKFEPLEDRTYRVTDMVEKHSLGEWFQNG